MKVFAVSLANVWPATRSRLHGELGRLADAGLIEAAALARDAPDGQAAGHRRPAGRPATARTRPAGTVAR
ncbi:hypothetical protein ACFQVD_23025 [Streptosporangium amethystogenes subsp. fukuiense]|uniref:Uncharacterized protein n=1 Tax=Streptosporangium amethystogenes subsp. fukuiense TaxID=698418 RepID=A0ABW2T3K8_9ACTN